MWLTSAAIIATPFAVAVGGITAMARRRGRREADAAAMLAEAQEIGADIPPSLHPVVDPHACICSGACIAACPEVDVLKIVNGTARLVNGAHCIGHGECASACPVDAIRLVFGSKQRGIDLPKLTPKFETTRLGLHIVGELGGMGLIKNAIRQGVQMGENLHQALSRPRPVGIGDAKRVDVVIVGGGPAGLATAITCKSLGLSFEVLEQGSVGGSIANYPRHKVVLTEAMELPLFGTIGASTLSKEALLEAWYAALKKADVTVREGAKVTDVTGQDGAFTVHSSAGEFHCRKVVLALGRRGTPRTLGVPGESLPNVAYQLKAPEQYAGKRVLVVGGGDSALESAIMLASQPHTKVSLSYRGAAAQRAKRRNLERLKELVAEGKIKAYYRSEVQGINKEQALLRQDGHRFVLRLDYVLVHIGGTLPDDFLEKLGIDSRRHSGDQAQPVPLRRSSARPSAPGKAPPVEHEALARRLVWGFAVLGVLGLAVLAVLGGQYYLLPKAARNGSRLHELLKPSGLVGHGVGIAATGVMMLNFFYAVRKRIRRFQSLGVLKDWLNLHMLVGAVTPVFIAFHAAFQANNVLAATTAGALTVVVGTGLFGRFLYGFVPTLGDNAMDLAELIAAWEQLRENLEVQAINVGISNEYSHLSSEFYRPPERQGSLTSSYLQLCKETVSLYGGLWRVRRAFPSREAYKTFEKRARHLIRMRLQIGAYEPLRRLLGVWQVFHIVLSCLLVFVIAAHITVAMLLGYGWILF
ncbi:MAG TPA: NAD(P)-binding domain-containing protein [Myxococcota bacterium]|nr:NAD(P)-binding domain-containing protein [Myxococcota bacterium]